MKEKEDKLKLVKQILVDDNATDVTIPHKESVPVTTINIPENATSSTVNDIAESTVIDNTPKTTTVQALAKMLESDIGDVKTNVYNIFNIYNNTFLKKEAHNYV